MAGDFAGISLGEDADVLLAPEVSGEPVASETELFQIGHDGGFGRSLGLVEESHDDGAVGHGLGPDLALFVFFDPGGLGAQFVLGRMKKGGKKHA